MSTFDAAAELRLLNEKDRGDARFEELYPELARAPAPPRHDLAAAPRITIDDVQRPLPQVFDRPPEEPRPAPRDPRAWSRLDKALQTAFLGTTFADYLQTRSFLTDPQRGVQGGPQSNRTWYETNPLLGKSPSYAKLALGVGGAMAGHTALAHYVGSGWPRTLVQLAGLLPEIEAVRHNHRNGVRINFGRAF